MERIKIKHNTLGDTRAATKVPTFYEFVDANKDHANDVGSVLASLPSAQPEKAQLSGEGTTSDCISRQAAIDAIDKLSDEPIGYLEAAIDALVDLPSAQPEIVYCKECICGHGEVWLNGNGSADFYGYCGRTQLRVLPYDYCSYAKRRTDESD